MFGAMSKEKPNYALAKIKAQEIIERFEYE